ncbi:kinase-like protein [Poronia punctata]|nr:kinase-like protein [Poronia punctata]
MTNSPPDALPVDSMTDHDGGPTSNAIQNSQQSDSQRFAPMEKLNHHNYESNRAMDSHITEPSIVSYDNDTITSPPLSNGHIQFESRTIAPPPSTNEHFPINNADLIHDSSPTVENTKDRLSLTTDIFPASPKHRGSPRSRTGRLSTTGPGLAVQRKTSASNLQPVARTPSWKQHFSKGMGSTGSSTYPSPVISAMGDVTPLPSPLLSSDSPGPWRRFSARAPSKERTMPTIMPDSVLITTSGESVAAALEYQGRRKVYAGLQVGHAAEHSSGKVEHTRNRSISEYVPDPKGIPKRQNTVSTGKGDEISRDDAACLRREPNLSESRGIVSATKPPTPPPSESSQTNDTLGTKKPEYEYFEARGRTDEKLRRWRGIKDLGEGTFSRVVLATNKLDSGDVSQRTTTHTSSEGEAAQMASSQLDRKSLVAIKICEHGPKGGASEDRIEMSLKRELDIMRSVHHPSLVHLKAWNIEPTRALLVLSYCPGGDLFDVASGHGDALKPPLLRRIFGEIVGAVQYLHERRIVHRDIKLENVLVNIPPSELSSTTRDWTTYPYPVVTVTDLGLSRRVADDEKLETRCGSDDYAAPEVILGQPYDGRATDAWSLGVLLYALLESRLPFDPPPGANDYQRMRSRTSHRIARVEWSWIKYAGDDGDHDANVALFEQSGLKGAMEITEGLLKRARSRWPLKQVSEHEWVRGAMEIEGGLRFPEEEEGQEV